MSESLRVLETGPLTTIQDAGRAGYAHLGVGRAGAFDKRAWRLANRLVGNVPEAAGLECLGGGLTTTALRHLTIAITGAIGPVSVNGRPHSTNTPLHLAAGDVVRLGPPRLGIRYYLAMSGGLSTSPVLGSRSYDTLGRIGPPPLAVGDILRSGRERSRHPHVDHVAPIEAAGVFDILPGPDSDETALVTLTNQPWDLDPQSDRIGVRLAGSPLPVALSNLPSKPMVLGAVQLPPNGLPIILGPDHPTTGGYPVIAVVTVASMCDVAQWSGGPRRFRRA